MDICLDLFYHLKNLSKVAVTWMLDLSYRRFSRQKDSQVGWARFRSRNYCMQLNLHNRFGIWIRLSLESSSGLHSESTAELDSLIFVSSPLTVPTCSDSDLNPQNFRVIHRGVKQEDGFRRWSILELNESGFRKAHIQKNHLLIQRAIQSHPNKSCIVGRR